jgi:EAL domain-containing protein (putative c-di-GMP-specific phosphodiesterase class I)
MQNWKGNQCIMLANHDKIMINEIIEQGNVLSYFQPIVSIKKKCIIGLEALSRGINPGNGKIIPPIALFNLAEERGLVLELDRLCREKAIAGFKSLPIEIDNYLLFLNINTAIIDDGVVGSGHLINMVNALGINPNNIVIEILESKAERLDDLKKFVTIYRDYGFLIAIDDIGIGESNLSRIPLIEPDILKIDISIIRDIDKDYYKQEVCKAIINLGRKIGALVIAEGVETVQEAMLALEYGADMLQGYFIEKPQDPRENGLTKSSFNILQTATYFRNHLTEKLQQRRRQFEFYESIVDEIIKDISGISLEDLNDWLCRYLVVNSLMECLYILDANGVQITDTICNCENVLKQKKHIFSPALKGTDHSMKDYFIFISAGQNKYVTDQYISLATGNLCLTIAKLFQGRTGEKFVLCIDINTRCAD